MIEKKIVPRYLQNVDVFIEDGDATSKYFQILEAPNVLPPGRSSILINGSDFLKQHTEILVELLDINDDTIYANPIHNVLEGTSRRIGVEVYQSTPPGEATLTILGEIDPEKVDFVIPDEFIGVYNVRFQKTFTVDPSSQNNVPIHFVKQPQIGVTEKIIKTITPSEGVFGVNTVVSGSISGRRIPLGESQVVNPASIKPVTSIISAPDINFPTEGVILNRKFITKLSSENSTGTIIKRRFDWGDGSSVSSSILRPIPNESLESHTYSRAGTYTAKLSVASPTGQNDQAFTSINISKPPAPSTDFSLNFTTGSMGTSTDPNVSGFPIVITDTTQNVTGISLNQPAQVSDFPDGTTVFDNLVDTEYSWSFGDGAFSNEEGQNTNGSIPINHTYSQTGSYSVHLNVKNAHNTQISSKTKGVLILPPPPIASFTIDSGSGHFPLVVSASNVTDSGSNPNSTLGGPDGKNIQAVSMSYAWDWGDGSTTAAKTDDSGHVGSGNHRYTDQSSDKTYTITLTATDQYDRSNEVKEDVNPVIASPKAVITATSASKSYPVTVHFNSAQSIGSAPSYPADHDNPRDWSAGKYIDSTSYYWQFENGDPATSNDANPSVAYSASKSDLTDHIAQLRLVATTGKNDVAEFLVKMEAPQKPAASFTTITANGFSPLEIKFHNSSSFDTTTSATYAWDFGDGNTSSGTSPTHTYAAGSATGRVYSPTLTITDGFGQTATFSKDITVKDPTPMANFGMVGGTTDILTGQSRQFSDLSSTPAGTTIASRSWTFTQGNTQQTSTAASPTITFNNAGYVTVKLTVTNSLGISHSKRVVNIFNVGLQPPTASGNLSSTTAYTNLTVVSVTSTSTSNHRGGIKGATIDWGDGTGNFSSGAGPTFTKTYDTAGSYAVKISAHDDTGSTTTTLGTVVVTAPAAPVISDIRLFGSSTGSKPHEVEAELVVSGTYDTIAWSSGDGRSATSRNIIFIYNSIGQKTLTVTATGPGGSSTKTKNITVFEDVFDDDDSDITDPEPTDTNNTDTNNTTGGGGGGGGCVLEGTLILTDRGYIPVEEVKLDDKVISYDFESEEFRDYEIKKAWNKLQPAWCFIETDLGFNLSCSDTHLIYHPDYKHNEIAVRDLVVGEIIYVYKDEKLYKDNVRNITFFEQEKRVYNFSIDDVKSYISDGILSHNEQKDPGNDPGGGESADGYGMRLASPAQITYEIVREDPGLESGSYWEQDMEGGIVTVPNIRTAIADSAAIRGLQGPDNTDISDNATWIIADTAPYIFKVLGVEREGWKPGQNSFGQSTKEPSWHPVHSPNGLKGMLTPELGPIVTNRVFETKGTVYKEYMDFAPTEYTMSYTKPVSMSYDVINKQSYAKVALTNMRTFSGQVHRIKIYFKSAGDLGQHGVLFDSSVASTDVLADELGHTGFRRLGWFADQVHIDKYWQGKEGHNAGLYNGNVEGNTIQCEGFQYHSGSLTYTGEIYGNTMMISGANMPENHYVAAYTKDIQGSSAESGSFRLSRGVEYALRAKVTGIQKKKQFRLTPTEASQQGGNQGLQVGPKAKLNFYLTGSAVESDLPHGRKLGWLEVENEPTHSFGIVEQNFTVAKSGDFKLQLVADSGQWHVRNIMIKPAREIGFSPDIFSITAKMPTLPRRPDQLRFFVEFYTADGKLSVKKAILPEFVQFEGDNIVIDGLENIVSGSLNIGSALGSGFEFFGGGSAYLRTVDYEGFTSASLNLARGGFLMWSGSVLSDSGDDYDGVGMEMHDGLGSGSFRFRTNPSELDIRTDKFFFGKDDQFISGANGTIAISSSKFYLGSHTQFVSGADGNIEISSSNFHLSASGDVTMQGKVTATSGDIGGWQLQTTTVDGTERTVLSGSNTTLDGTGAALYMSNKGPDTNKTDGYYIDFSPDDQPPGEQYYIRFGSNFAVRDDGQLFASGAKIEGILTASEGFIGGWTIGSGSLYKVQGGKYTGLSTTGNTRFFAGAPSLAGSGSGVFSVKNTGDITGSQVLFTGGKIAGATIGNSRLSYGSNWAISASTVPNEFFISSSKFNVKQNGDMTASNFLFDGSGMITGSVTIGKSATILGSLSAESLHVPTSTAPNYLAEIHSTGYARFVSASIGGFDVNSVSISDTSNNLVMSSSGQITGSTVLFDGGTIAGWTIEEGYISKALSGSAAHQDYTRVYLSATTDTDKNIAEGLQVYRKDQDIEDGEVKIVRVGGLSNTDNLHANNDFGLQVIKKDTNDNYSNIMYIGTGSQKIASWNFDDEAIFTGTKGSSGAFTSNGAITLGDGFISAENFFLDTDGNARLFGTISASAGNIAGWTLDGSQFKGSNTVGGGDGSFTTSGMLLHSSGYISAPNFFLDSSGNARLYGTISASAGNIAGWTLSSDRLTGGDLQFFKDGTIKSSNYQSDLKGWMITSTVQNGYAEFENARIRGTLSTTVFEKEKVSAVGGQIIVSNSTTISGSAFSASEATMSVENASGWAENEVVAIKKVSPTGFSTEYVRIISSSRINPSSDVDFTGALYVTRSFGGSETYAGSASLSPDSGSSASHNYEPGQVIVSTGRYISGDAPHTVGTGYVKINANPSDPATPYIDIVERTGSGIYDLELKARLGDLSGVRNFVSGGVEVVPTDPGFGLFTQNVFLSGKIFATSGRIGGLVMEPQEIYSGTGTYGNSNTPFYVDSDGRFSLGDKLTWDESTETLTVAGTINVTAGSGFATPASVSASFMTPAEVSASIVAASASLSESVASYATSTSASIAERTMTTALGRITKTPAISGEGLFLTSEHMGYASNGAWSTYVSSSGEFLYKIDDDNLISYSAQSGSSLIIKTNEAILSGSSITLLTDKFFFGNSGSAPFEGSYISGSGGSLEISSSNFFLKEDGTLNVGAGDFTVDTDGNITGSDVRFTGGRIAGWIMNGDKLQNPDASFRINGRTTTPKITIGNHSFESAGIQLGYHSDGTLKFYAGDGATDYIKYTTGTGVEISGTVTIKGGSGFATAASVSSSFGTAAAISGSVSELSGSVDTSLTRIGTQLVLDSTGMSLKDASSNTLATYGATVTIGQDANDKSRMYMDSDSVDLIVDAGGTDTTYASFGATTTVGPTSAEHTSISSTGIELKDASTVVGKFNAGGATIGSTGGRHVSASTSEVTVKYDSNNYTVLDSNSLDIILEGQTTASFGATTSIGPTGGNHVLIDSDGVKIKNSSTTFLSASAGGMYTSGHIHASHGTIGGFVIGSSTITGGSLSLNSAGSISLGNFSVDTSGNVTARGSAHTFDGTITAHTLEATGSGRIGGFYIGGNDIWGGNATIGNSGTTMVLGNLDGTSKIALGASADAINLDDTGTGFYADGGGNMRVGSTTRHIKWDANDLHVKSRAFNIGSSATSFISGSVEGHLEISSSQFHVSGGLVVADRSKLRRVSEADYFNYRSITIGNAESTSDMIYLNYSQSAGGTVYTALILDSSQGGVAAGFCRMEQAPTHPIGMIITPGRLQGHVVTLEGNVTTYYARGKGVAMTTLSAQAISQGKNPMGIDADPYISSNFGQDAYTSTYAFWSDDDDIVGGGTNNTDGDSFWSYDVTVDSVAHTDLARISSGNRIQFTKSTFDFRMTAISGYSDFTPNFEKGIAAYGGLTAGLRYGNNGTYKNYTVGSVGATVDVVAYASDERLKENIEPFVCGSVYLDKIKPVEFDWNEKAYEIGFEPNQPHEIGFIAQELEEVLPQSVAFAPINKKDDDYLTVKEEKLIPILVSSLKEQRNEIADLKEDIKELKKVIKEL